MILGLQRCTLAIGTYLLISGALAGDFRPNIMEVKSPQLETVLRQPSLSQGITDIETPFRDIPFSPFCKILTRDIRLRIFNLAFDTQDKTDDRGALSLVCKTFLQDLWSLRKEIWICKMATNEDLIYLSQVAPHLSAISFIDVYIRYPYQQPLKKMPAFEPSHPLLVPFQRIGKTVTKPFKIQDSPEDRYQTSRQSLALMTNLQKLCINTNAHITDEEIKKLTNLTTIELTSWGHKKSYKKYGRIYRSLITGHSLRSLPHLTSLNLGTSMVGDEDLKGLLHLKMLKLEHTTKITDAGLFFLPQLEDLHLGQNKSKITIKGLAHLHNLKRLHLGFYNKHLDEDVSLLTQVTDLTLGYSSSCATDRALWNMTQLTSLDLGTAKITDNGINPLINLRKLNIACIDKITDYSLSALTNLKELSLGYSTQVTDHSISSLTNLTKLSLSYESFTNKVDHETITDRGIAPLINLICLNVENGCKSLTIDGLISLTQLTALNIAQDILGNTTRDKLYADAQYFMPHLKITRY